MQIRVAQTVQRAKKKNTITQKSMDLSQQTQQILVHMHIMTNWLGLLKSCRKPGQATKWTPVKSKGLQKQSWNHNVIERISIILSMQMKINLSIPTTHALEKAHDITFLTVPTEENIFIFLYTYICKYNSFYYFYIIWNQFASHQQSGCNLQQ